MPLNVDVKKFRIDSIKDIGGGLKSLSFDPSNPGGTSGGLSGGIGTYHYPSYITDDAYKNRRVTFIASTRPALHGMNSDDATTGSTLAAIEQKLPDAIAGYINTNSAVKNSDLVTVASFTLPLPNELSDNQSHEWKQDTGKPLKNFNDALAKTDIPIVSDIAQAISTAGDTIDNSLGYATQRAGIRKPLMDPDYFQNYEGSTPRSFTFNFEFMPDSQSEAEDIARIILKFKEYSSPSLHTCGCMLLAPFYWDMYMSNDSISNLLRLDTMVCKSINVSYGADGQMQLFADGFPKFIKMSLEMAEATLTYADNYRNPYSSWVQTRAMNNQDKSFSDIIDNYTKSGANFTGDNFTRI